MVLWELFTYGKHVIHYTCAVHVQKINGGIVTKWYGYSHSVICDGYVSCTVAVL